MTITTDQIVMIAGVLGAISVIYGIVSKPFKAIEDLKKSVDDMSEKVDKVDKAVTLHGDMIYELLDHAATNNNSGGMREALDKYNAYYRH